MGRWCVQSQLHEQFLCPLRASRSGIQFDGAGGYFAGASYLKFTIEGERAPEVFMDSFEGFDDE